MKEPKHATARARRTQLSRKKAPRPTKVANSAQRSTRESTSAPRGLATPARRATPPSRTSSVPATMVSQPPTNSHPAQNAAPASTLTASCAPVSASGWTRAPLLGEIVGQLARGVLHQVGRHAQEGAADPPIARHAAAADGVDHAAGGVGAVLDREPELELDGRVREAAALHAQEADLVVALPRDVVARPEV